jgi:hypothetical protein
LLAVSAGFAGAHLTFTGAWQRLGRGVFAEDTWHIEVAVRSRWRPRLRWGRRRLAIGETSSVEQSELQPGLSFPLSSNLVLDLDVPLLAAPVWFGEGGLRRWLRLRGHSASGLWAVALDRGGDGTPRIQLEVSVVAGSTGCFGLRAEPASGAFGLVTAFHRGAWMIRTSHLVHPELGPTHRWSFAAGSLTALW